MIHDPDLFSYVPPIRAPYRGEAPFQAHSETSKSAAKKIKKSIGPLHQRILDYLDAHPEGATDEHLCDAIGFCGSTERPRRRELELLSRVKDSGRTAPTKSGRQAVIWVKS